MKNIVLISLFILSINLYSQDTLDFINNESIKKEIYFVLKFLDKTPKTKILKDSLVFIEINYDRIIPFGEESDMFSISYHTTLRKDLYKIRNEKIFSYYHFESFYYKQLRGNRVLLFRDAKTILKKKLMKIKIEGICDRMMDYEFFEPADFTSIEEEGFRTTNSFQYSIKKDGSLKLDFIDTHDIEIFMSLRYGVILEQTLLKYPALQSPN